MAQVTPFLVFMAKTNGERMATMEQKVVDLALKVDEIYHDVKEIKECVGNSQALRGDIEKRLARIEKQSNLWRFLSPTIAAILGSVMTFLIIEYLKSK